MSNESVGGLQQNKMIMWFPRVKKEKKILLGIKMCPREENK